MRLESPRGSAPPARASQPAHGAGARDAGDKRHAPRGLHGRIRPVELRKDGSGLQAALENGQDRKSTRLNSSHVSISYAVFCLKKKKKIKKRNLRKITHKYE